MTALGHPIDALADDLVAALDEELALLEGQLEQLTELCQALIASDNARLEEVLRRIERAQQEQAALDARLGELRGQLAGRIGCPRAEMRLSRLAGRVDASRQADLEGRRQQILQAARTVRKKHRQAAALLSQSARINQLMLEVIFPRRESVTTYSQGGTQAWRSDVGLVDAER